MMHASCDIVVRFWGFEMIGCGAVGAILVASVVLAAVVIALRRLES